MVVNFEVMSIILHCRDISATFTRTCYRIIAPWFLSNSYNVRLYWTDSSSLNLHWFFLKLLHRRYNRMLWANANHEKCIWKKWPKNHQVLIAQWNSTKLELVLFLIMYTVLLSERKLFLFTPFQLKQSHILKMARWQWLCQVHANYSFVEFHCTCL